MHFIRAFVSKTACSSHYTKWLIIAVRRERCDMPLTERAVMGPARRPRHFHRSMSGRVALDDMPFTVVIPVPGIFVIARVCIKAFGQRYPRRCLLVSTKRSRICTTRGAFRHKGGSAGPGLLCPVGNKLQLNGEFDYVCRVSLLPPRGAYASNPALLFKRRAIIRRDLVFSLQAVKLRHVSRLMFLTTPVLLKCGRRRGPQRRPDDRRL